MITRLRAAWHDVNASYWFYPALFSVAALALAIGTVWLDRQGAAKWLSDVAVINPARPQSAIDMLTVIAGSMIGVAATVFSITIAAVAYASGNYGPRLLNNFMEDRGNQLSLATFIGTFVYALTVLRTVRREDEASALIVLQDSPLPGFVPQLSLLVAYLLTGLSIGVLVYFLNHIPASIRINTVLEGIGERLLKGIERDYPDDNRGPHAAIAPQGVPVWAEDIGYIQLIDFGRLQDLAEDHDGRMVMSVRPGDFVHPDMVLAYWQASDDANAEGGDDAPEIPFDDIRSCLALGSMRTPHQDLRFLIDELVEIGLRALSPGINDPFTAITAMHWLGAATAQLGKRDLRLKVDRSIAIEDALVVPADDDFHRFLARGFGAMRSATATNRIAALAMFDSLEAAATTLDDESRLAMIRQEGEQLLAQAREHLTGPELHLVEARHAGFAPALAGAAETRA